MPPEQGPNGPAGDPPRQGIGEPPWGPLRVTLGVADCTVVVVTAGVGFRESQPISVRHAASQSTIVNFLEIDRFILLPLLFPAALISWIARLNRRSERGRSPPIDSDALSRGV